MGNGKWFAVWRKLSTRIEEGISIGKPGSEKQETLRSVLFEMNRLEMELVTGEKSEPDHG